ncbi:MAG: DNA polymerase I [candidate division WOR-3 bacterium]
MKQLLLVDGHSLIYRSYYAFIRQPLRNSKGVNTSAVFGFANTMKKLLAELKPDLCAVAFDAPGKTFRDEKFAEYKAQRPPPPSELPGQIPIVKELARAMGLTVFEKQGYEADDIIATLAYRAVGQGFGVTVATADKDMLQLVGDRIEVYDPWQEKRFTPEAVREKLGVEPAMVPDLLALAGDSIDNVPGVPGVGPKRAQKILERFGSLEAALTQDERVREHAELARLSRELVKLRTDVDIDVRFDELAPGRPDREALARIYQALEFKTLLRELEGGRVPEVRVAGYSGVESLRQAGRFGFWLAPAGRLWVSIDGVSAMAVEGDAAQILGDPVTVKVGHGLKETISRLHRDGIALMAPVFDIGVGAWLLDPNRKRFGLEDVALMVLGEGVVSDDPAARAVACLRIYEAMKPQLTAMGLLTLAEEIEMPLVSVLARMEERGVKIDRQFFSQLEQELAAEQERVEREIWRLAGVEFNVSSPKQLGDVLFGRLKLARGKKTKTGYSTSFDVLEQLAGQHPIAAQVLKYRELGKLCSTYLRPLLALSDTETGRIRTVFNQTGTSTGRLSTATPNLQNIPIRTELGRRVRHGFIAEQGNLMISADYSQIEMRVLAHLSGDERLQEAFEKGEDIHVATAAAILNIAPEAVSADQRRIAKMVNYGLVYGMGDYGLSWRMGISIDEARAFLDGYMQRFAGVARWRDSVLEQARQQGFVRTISGRIRPVPGVADSNRTVAEAAGRAALNAPVQGSAADIIKRAMLNIEERLPGAMILQVHDELLFEVEETRATAAAELIREEMASAWQLSVPLVVEVRTGQNWGEVH